MDWQRFIPGFWSQNEKTDLDWDRALNVALDAGNITEITRYTVKVDGVLVWVENWPYGYGSLRSPECRFLPKVATRKRLRKAILDASIAQALANQEQPQ